MAVIWHCACVTTKTGADLSMTVRGSCGSTFRGLIKGASQVLCPISVDDDLVHLVFLDIIVGLLASLIALKAAIGNRGRVGGRRVRADSLNEAHPMDFDSSEPGGLCFPAARGGLCDGDWELAKLQGE